MFNEELNHQNLLLLEKAKENTNQIISVLNYFIGHFQVKKEYYKNNNYNNDVVIEIGEKETMTKRSDNRYVKTININNVRKYIYGKTKKECYDKYIALKNNNKKLLTISNKNNIKIYDWLIEWYETFKKNFVSEETQKEIMRIINTNLKYFHNKILNKLTTTEIQKHFNNIPKSRPKEKTILYFKASITKAFELGKIKTNPFSAFIQEKKINNIRPPFTYAEQEQIINRLDKEEIKPIILIYLITGLRKQEFNFKTIEKDIDIENKTLKAINLKQREDEPTYKNIDLSDNGLKLILDNLEIIKNYNQNKVYENFKNILKELKIKGSIHTLRHTFGTNCMYLGIPTKIYSKWLGHSTTQITEDIYTGIDKNITKEKINKLYNNLYINF